MKGLRWTPVTEPVRPVLQAAEQQYHAVLDAGFGDEGMIALY